VITEVVIALALLALGVAIHFAVGRAARRLPRWLARRRGEAIGPGVRGERAFRLGAVVAQAALWLALLFALSERFEPLMQARGWSLMLLVRALDAELFTVGERAYSALDLIALPLLLIVLWVAVGLVVRVIRSQVFEAAGVESGLQETLAILLRYALTFVGALVLLQGFGVDVRSLAIAASVLGVGIGFGLQNIANNFVSGLLLNLERPIRPGDYVNVGAFEGTVLRIGGRSTTIRTLDGVLILVPNSKFLETEVVNWNLGDPRSRVHVPVGVAYGTDVARLRRALLEVARSHPEVEADPRPQVQMIRFGESSLDFELLVWTRDPRDKNRLESDLNFMIEECLRKHGIEVPFPQRDLHLRSPGLEQAARAWARRVAPELAEAMAEPAAKLGAEQLARDAEPLEARDRSPDEWSEAEVTAALGRLLAAGEVTIRDRRHLLKLHRAAFVGREAVDWLVMNEKLTRGEAALLGERWIAQGLVRHVLDEHGFRDGHFYYQLRGGPQRASA
jgi:small-conductance mechanosensitive channel